MFNKFSFLQFIIIKTYLGDCFVFLSENEKITNLIVVCTKSIKLNINDH